MFIYLFVFFISTLLYYWGTRFKGLMRCVLYSLSILIPSVLAGCRDLSIGRDMATYAIRVWEVTCYSKSISEAITYFPIIEPMYIGLNFIVSKFTNDMHWFLFVHMLMLMVLTVISAHKYRATGKSWLLVAFVLLYLYNTSLSMMRQSIAVLIVFYGCTFLQEKKILKFYLCVLIAYFAHYSAIFVTLLYPIILILNRFKNRKITLFVWIASATFAILTLYRVIMASLINMGLLNMKYEHYLDQEGYRSHKMDLLVIALLSVGILLIARKFRNNDNISKAFFIFVLTFCIYLMGDIVEVADRIAAYMWFLPISYILSLNVKSISVRFTWLLLTLMMVKWFYNASVGFVDTVPYTSTILGVS